MSDSELIKRQDAINALGEEPMNWSDTDWELGIHQQWEWDLEGIKNIPSYSPWIYIKDELPDLDEMVLIYQKNGSTTMGWRSDNFIWFTQEGEFNAVTPEILAWMPLPDPPKHGE